jgi:hypothetical protein
MSRQKKTQPVKRTVGRKTRTVNQETVENESQKTFLVLTDKMWFTDKNKIKVGKSMSEILSGETQIIDIKEILVGENYKTWTIVIDTEDKYYLLKTSKELK